MKINHFATTKGGQDGAIYGEYMFRFSAKGLCRVYDMKQIMTAESNTDVIPHICEFTLDRAEEIVPHSNAVVFGNEYYAEGDEFPLLYSNIYNNYAKGENKREENKLVGVCCVYRLTRNGNEFSTKLVQLIEIGFTDDRTYWRSAGDVADVRPYGNFVVDAKNSKYYGFVMRDADNTTRTFEFDLPKLSDGVIDEKYGVKKVTLTIDDIKTYFDTPYQHYIQGACFHDGKIYSVVGFDKEIHPMFHLIDVEKKQQIFEFDFFEAGIEIEAEFIDFYGDKCIYSDAHGALFELSF